jgi:hypothetical protein
MPQLPQVVNNKIETITNYLHTALYVVCSSPHPAAICPVSGIWERLLPIADTGMGPGLQTVSCLTRLFPVLLVTCGHSCCDPFDGFQFVYGIVSRMFPGL